MQPQITHQSPNSSLSAPSPRVRIVCREHLHHNPDGITAGWAHVGFPGHPADGPGHLEFRPLLLCAVGEVTPGSIAEQHPHSEVEILDVLVSGRMRYEDSLGNQRVFGPGAVVASSAGTGLHHGVEVESGSTLRGLILFIEPNRAEATPRVTWNENGFGDGLRTLVSGRSTAPAGALPVLANIDLRGGRLRAGTRLHHDNRHGRGAYLLSLSGDYTVDGQIVRAGDRVLVEGRGRIELEATDDLELFLIDLPRA